MSVYSPLMAKQFQSALEALETIGAIETVVNPDLTGKEKSVRFDAGVYAVEVWEDGKLQCWEDGNEISFPDFMEALG